ncbi:MAG TPA: hypothetical protein QGF85_07675 [Acidimicrobiales bacterium]|jgi:hypothetical protein|nr:hypothetical protein [Acidimicrobiales bacterium]
MEPGACIEVVVVSPWNDGSDPTTLFDYVLEPLEPGRGMTAAPESCETVDGLASEFLGDEVEVRVSAPNPWDGGPFGVYWLDDEGTEHHLQSFSRNSTQLTAYSGDVIIVRRHDRGLEVVPNCDDAGTRRPLVHERHQMSWWTVYVECLVYDTPGLAESLIGYTRDQMATAADRLPSTSIGTLRHTPVWIDVSFNDPENMAIYMEDVQDPGSVDLPYVNGIRVSAEAIKEELAYEESEGFAIHELAHAWHCMAYDPCWSGTRIMSAYAAAMSDDLYDSVPYLYGGNERAYAATDDAEYFAELSEAWFDTNDYFPFNRDEVRAHDPNGAKVVEAAWRLIP